MTSVAHDPVARLEKRCCRCEVTQPLAAFGKRSASPDGLHVYCRVCWNLIMQEFHAIKRGDAVRFRVERTDRQCTRCLERKPLGDFGKRGDSTRATSWCKACANEDRRRKYATDPEFRAAQGTSVKQWRAADPDRARAYQARYRAEYPEVRAATNRAWRLANPDLARAAVLKRRAIISGATVTNFSAKDIAGRMAYFGNRCWMCKGPFEHVDHVKPISKGGPHALANLRPACSNCNHRKSSKWYGPQELHRFIKN